MDPVRKIKYDSALPFDDKIPLLTEIKLNGDNFFELYEPTFKRNARFSIVKPVPSIGDMNTPMDQVYIFYTFWDNFKSWRGFSQYDEYDTEEAHDRYEKRWMEQ